MAAPSLVARSCVLPRRPATNICIFCCQRRQMAAKAPTTRHKQRQQRAVAITPELRAARRDLDMKVDELKHALPGVLSTTQKMEWAGVSLPLASLLSRNQTIFLWHLKMYSNFKNALELSKASLDEIYELTFILRNKGGTEDAMVGRRMVWDCAAAGHGEANIQVVAGLLRKAFSDPGLLKTREAISAQNRLRDISTKGNTRALVLEARLADRRGDQDLAIKLFEEAIDHILDPNHSYQDKYAKVTDELSSPWLELAYTYLRRGEHTKALSAYMIGLDQDDPMAYYNLANLEHHQSGGEYTQEWLYNMTKAAASGYFRAADALGRYYADSPPAPVPDEGDSPKAPFLHRIKGFAAFLLKPTINLDPKANVNHHAAFAQDPILRIKLARKWFTTASEVYYTPSSIHLAQIYLQRYIYPSENLSRPLDPFGSEAGEGAIENPFYDPQNAHDQLAMVMIACRRVSEAKRISKTNSMFRANALPWTKNPEVLEAFDSDAKLADLEETVTSIADAAGIDIRIPESELTSSGVLYRHKGVRGEGLFEVSE